MVLVKQAFFINLDFQKDINFLSKDELIERLKKSNYAKIDLVILNDTPKEALSLYQKIKNNWSSLILILFIKVCLEF